MTPKFIIDNAARARTDRALAVQCVDYVVNVLGLEVSDATVATALRNHPGDRGAQPDALTVAADLAALHNIRWSDIDAKLARLKHNRVAAAAFVSGVALDLGLEADRAPTPARSLYRAADAENERGNLPRWNTLDLAARIAEHHGFSWADLAADYGDGDVPFA